MRVAEGAVNVSDVKRTEDAQPQPHAERTTGKTKRVLVIGKGGREHALCWALSRSPRVERVFCAPGNAGTAQLGRNVALEPSDFKGLARFAQNNEIDLVVVGPEEPLCQGLADHLRDQGLKVFGPSAEAAELEGSKLFAKELMKQAGIPTAEAKVFDGAKDAETYVLSREVMLTIRPRNHHAIRQTIACRSAADCLEAINTIFDPRDYPNPALEIEIIGRNQKHLFRKGPEAREFILRQPLGLVVKADGLAAGKGVEVCDDFRGALDAIQRIMVRREFGKAGDKILIEERLEGPETSVLALTDGRTIAPLDIAQDFKRAFDNDEGPNTGGMGAYSPTAKLITPEVMARIEEQVLVPAVHFMKKRRRPFQGVLYAGLILTEQGPKVLEFNVRFGDPECQVLLPRLKSDLYELLEAVVEERLEEVELEWDTRASVCVNLVSEGYPGPFEKDKAISGLEEAARVPDVVVFHAGTKTNHEGRVLTDGGRVLNVVGLGDTLAQARDRAYQAATLIRFQGRRYRNDIALHAVEHG
mgnify:CR=1 FL=1